MTEQPDVWRIRCGVSLHCLSHSVTAGEFDLLGQSMVETLELSPPMVLGDSELRAGLHEILANGGVRAATVHSVFGLGKDLSSSEASVRATGMAEARRAIDVASEFGASMIVLHASSEPISPEERGEHLCRCRDSLAEVGRYAAEYDKKVAVELLPRTCLGNTAQELLELLSDLDPERFGVCLDTNHLMDRWESLPQVVARLGDRLWTTHISDYDGVDEKHWRPGQGVVRWPDLLKALCDTDYRGPFNYETGLVEGSFSERLEALQENFRWMVSMT